MLLVVVVIRVGMVRSVTLSCDTLRCGTATEVACGILFGTVDARPSILRTRLVLSKAIND